MTSSFRRSVKSQGHDFNERQQTIGLRGQRNRSAGERTGVALGPSRHTVSVASRDEAKAKAAAQELNSILGSNRFPTIMQRARPCLDHRARGSVRVAISTSPRSRNSSLGKILIDVTVPLVPPKVSTVQLPKTQLLRRQHPEAARRRTSASVSAFQNVSAHNLKRLDYNIDCDVLVTCDDKDAREVGIGLAKDAGLRGIDAGPLANSVVAEALTSALIWINRG